MTNDTMINEIKGHNERQKELRKDLPNLIGMIEDFQAGNHETFELYFYGHKERERHFYDGSMKTVTVENMRFWDNHLSVFLTNMKKKFCKAVAIGESNFYGERKITYKTNISNFEESEIDTLFYEWMLDFVADVELDKFEKETEEHKLNALRLYIKKSFSNHLKKINNEKIKLERVRVDGQLYYVKNREEEVFFEDIYLGVDDEGNKLDFLDIVEHEDTYDVGEQEYEEYTNGDYISDNLEDILTKKQWEKYQLLLDHVEKYGIQSILDKNTGRIVKAEAQRIMYPEKEYKNNERVDSLLKIMNKRVAKALDMDEFDKVELYEEEEKETHYKSEVVVYTGGLSEEEVEKHRERHFERIYKSYTIGDWEFKEGPVKMTPTTDRMKSLTVDEYERFIKGSKKEKIEIIKNNYNPDKFKLTAGKKVVKEVKMDEKPKNKHAQYITPDELREIYRKSGK